MSNILFNTEMVRAILNGDKTQTRRVLKPQPLYGVGSCHYCNSGFAHLNKLGSCECRPIKCPYGGVGDEIWVRETWATVDVDDDLKPSQLFPPSHDCPSPIYYAATQDFSTLPMCGKTRPSIFMPRWASRLTLTVTAVRVEQLHDIIEADAVQEGIDRTAIHGDYTARFRFAQLWESINAKRGEYEKDELWIPSAKLQKGVYEFCFDGGDWEKLLYWPHWYDSATDRWVGASVGDDPEAIELDVLDMTKTLVKLPSGEVLTFRQQNLSRKAMRLNYGWDKNPWVWVIEFEVKEANHE